MPKRQTFEQFVADIVAKEGPECNGDTFPVQDLPKSTERMRVVCGVHGEYEITPSGRKRGQRCNNCWESRRGQSIKLTIDDVFDRLRNLVPQHPDTLDFTKSVLSYKGGDAIINYYCHVVDPKVVKSMVKVLSESRIY